MGKYTFKYSNNETNGTSVVSFEEDDLYEILLKFQAFLQSVGFSFRENETLQILPEEDTHPSTIVLITGDNTALTEQDISYFDKAKTIANKNNGIVVYIWNNAWKNENAMVTLSILENMSNIDQICGEFEFDKIEDVLPKIKEYYGHKYIFDMEPKLILFKKEPHPENIAITEEEKICIKNGIMILYNNVDAV